MDPDRQLRELRSSMRDLVALATIPAAWVGREPQQLAEGIADLLLSALRLDAIYVELHKGAADNAVESSRAVEWPQFAAWARQVVAENRPIQKAQAVVLPADAPPPRFSGVRVALTPIGLNGEGGVILSGNRRADYPSETDSLLLSVAANQAQVALSQAGLLQDLRSNQRELQDFVENATVGLHWVGPDGTILWANKAELQMLGYQRHEYVGRNISEFHADREAIAEILRRLSRGEQLYDVESRLLCKDGSVREVLLSSNAYFEAGKFVHTRCFTRDVTERKRAEKLRAELAAIVESSDDAIIGKTLDGIITSWNKGAERLYGYTAEEVLGRPINLITPPDRAREVSLILERLKRGERIEHFETVRKAKDGHLLDVSVTISPIQDGAGNIIGASAVARDIGAAKAAEQELRASEERFRRAQRAAKIGAFDLDVASGRVVWFAKVPTLADLRNQDTLESWLRLVHPGDRDRVRESLARLLREGGESELESRIVKSDGSIVWLYVKAHLLRDHHGLPIQVAGVAMDITERKHTEEALRNAEKLAATGSLAASIAHEINNPMQSLTNLLDLITSVTSAGEQVHGLATMAETELRRIAHITRQMLSFYRNTSVPVAVKLTEVIEDALEMWAVKLRARNIRVERRYEFTEEIYAFPAEIRQLVANLLANAFEAITSGGRIYLHVYASQDWRMKQRDGVRIVIADNGSGIDPGIRGKVFEPFFTTKAERGTGLGLWVVRGVVEKHEGMVRVRSSVHPGRSGTCFSIFLPRRAFQETAAKGLASSEKAA